MLAVFIIVVVSIIVFIRYQSRRFYNPYKCIGLIGKKGSGKNTLLTKWAIKYNKMGFKVFSDSEIYGTFKLDTDWIGRRDFPTDSVIMVEEAGITWSNREFKSFPKELRAFLKLQRHKRVIFIWCSQSLDTDKVLRDITDDLYIIQNYLGCFSVAKKVVKHISIHNGSDNNDGESKITETYSFAFPWDWIYTYIPRYIQFFNSFSVEKLPPIRLSRYRFNNESELYKRQYYLYYKEQQLRDIFYSLKQKLDEKKQSVNLTIRDIIYINGFQQDIRV